MKISNINNRIYDNLAIFYLFIIFLYTCLRAYGLSLTHDEVITYLVYSKGSIFEIFTSSKWVPSNNHLLNTFLVKIFTIFFGSSEFVIRTPALLGHILYLSGIYKLLKLFLKKHLFLLGVCLLASHPFMLDFFSCARGYSLGLGFSILGLYYFLRRVEGRVEYSDSKSNIKNTTLSSIMFGFSVLSHFSFLNMFILIITGLVILEFRDSPNITFERLYEKVILPVLRVVLVLLILCHKQFTGVKKDALMYDFGGSVGFWHDTVGSLIQVSLYGKNYYGINMILLFKILIAALLVFSSIFLIYKLIKQEFGLTDKYLFWMIILMFLYALSTIFQHIVFNTVYIFRRTAIFFIPMFLIFALISRESFKSIQNRFIGMSINFLYYIFSFIFIVHFISCFNFTHFVSWKYDASTKDMMRIVMKTNKGKKLEKDSVKMGITWGFEPSINYYRGKNKLTWLKPVNRNSPDGKYDYYYLHEADREILKKHKLRVIKKFDLSGSYLAIP
jgi:hypothetical protein